MTNTSPRFVGLCSNGAREVRIWGDGYLCDTSVTTVLVNYFALGCYLKAGRYADEPQTGDQGDCIPAILLRLIDERIRKILPVSAR